MFRIVLIPTHAVGHALQLAFDAGTCTKVLEFVALKDRLAASHTRAAALAEVQLQRVRAT